MPRYPGFVGGSYTSQSKIAAADRCVNWYVEKIESGTGAAAYVLYPTPGTSTYCTLATTPTRGSFTLNGTTWAVGGGSLYRLPLVSGGSATTLVSGLNNPDNSQVTIASNGDAGGQLMITSGSKLYVYDIAGNTLTLITDVPAASVAAFADGYFIALDPNTSTAYASALEDGSSWDALDIAQRNDAPDRFLWLLVHRKELWWFGSQTTAVWYNSGADGFPFTPNPSAFIREGIGAPNSAAILQGGPAWVSSNIDGTAKVVWAPSGYTAQRISNHAIEYALSQYAAAGTLSDADAFTYQQDGHDFYVLNFPSANATWCYDATSGFWHERGPWDDTAEDYGVLPYWGHVNANGVSLVGDRTTGAIYQLSNSVYTETDGTTGIRRMRRAPHMQDEHIRIAYARFELRLESGLGLTSGQGSDPTVMLRWSNDGGQTFGNVHTASAGRIGKFNDRVIWRNLGAARDRVFEVSVSDPIPWRLIDAYLAYRPGRS